MTRISDILSAKRMNLTAESRTWPGIKNRLWQGDYASIELKLLEEFNKSKKTK